MVKSIFNSRIRAIVCLLAVSGLFAQTPPPRTGETINVTVIEVPVNVYDRGGNAIRGLTAADFELTDDGVRREITHFEVVDLAKAAVQPQAPPPSARRNFMLLFDLASSSPGTIQRGREAAAEFIKKELVASDLVAVASFNVEDGFRLLLNFTADRDALNGALSTLSNPRMFKKADPLLLTAKAVGMGEMGTANEKQAGTRISGGVSLSEMKDGQWDFANNKADLAAKQADDEEQRGRIYKQLASLANVGRVLDSIHGRKQIILLSEGFDPRLVQGRDGFGTAVETITESDKVVKGEGYAVNNDSRFGNTTAAVSVAQLGELFRRSDVVLHAIDIKGLRSTSDVNASVKRVSNEGLYALARPTGGEVFKNSNDLSSNFHALLKQQEVIYILGFEAPQSAKPGKFHNLGLKVKTPGARVSYRSGYYEQDANISGVEMALTAGQILLNDIAADAISLNVVAAPFPVKGKNPQVPVVIEIDGKSLLAGVRPQSDEAGVAKWDGISGELFVYAFDRDNKAKDFLYQRFEFDIAKVGETLKKSGVKYYGTLSLPPGDYAIKTLVRIPQATLDGFKRVDLTVPDFSKPSVTPPVAMDQTGGGWLMVRGSKPDQSYEYPFAVASQSFVPGIVSGTPQRLALFLYHVDPKDIALNVTLKTPDGSSRPAKVSIVGVTAPDAAAGSQMVLELKTDGLAAGKYALDLSVKAKSGGWSKAFTIPVPVQ